VRRVNIVKAGIGLPSTIPGVTGREIVEWSEHAETYGFSSLAVLDRLVYSNVEPLIALAAAAAVTSRIELATTILIGPYQGNAALLAKQLASIDLLSDGRLVLGIAAGTREDDYEASHVDYSSRGRLFDAMLDEFDQVWSSASGNLASGIGPKPPRRPTLIFGGTAPATFRRAATRGDGWIMGGGDAAAFERGIRSLTAAWEEAGRQDQPRTSALAYFALGTDGPDHARDYLSDYYAFLGASTAGAIAQSAATDVAAVRARMRDFAEAGCGELVFIPCNRDPEQVRLLSEALA
jgi:alkanesulfonate monooxygenase SsuD/methylene tetrahydromethanopterin reductase-like flavin-dependent oxidoreductase (luciferase family)